MNSKGSWSVVGLLALLVAGVLLAGCGGGGGSSSGETSAPTEETGQSEGGQSALVEEATAKAAASEEGGEFPPLGAPFKPGTGKIAIISCSQTGPDCKNSSEDSRQAAKAMGWDAKVFDAEFSPQKAAGFVEQAVQEGYDGVISVAVPVGAIKSAVNNALSSGVAVACTLCLAEPGFDEVHFASMEWEKEGEELAWYLIAESGGKSKMLVYHDPGQPAVELRQKGLEAVIGSECPECDLTSAEISETEIGKPGPPQFVGELSKYPEGTLDSVVDPYDAIGVPMAKTLAQQGRTDITVSGYEATLEGMQGLTNGTLPMGGTMATPWSYAGWVSVDAIARQKAGATDSSNETQLPTVLITKKHAADYIDEYYAPENFEQEFEETWK